MSSRFDHSLFNKNKKIIMKEVMENGEVHPLECSLRKLLCFVNMLGDAIDDGVVPSPPPSLSHRTPRIRSAITAKSSDIHNEATVIGLRVRDLRRLDFSFHPKEQEHSIWVRKHAVLLILDPIRAVVMASRVVIIVPVGGMDSMMTTLEQQLGDWRHQQYHDIALHTDSLTYLNTVSDDGDQKDDKDDYDSTSDTESSTQTPFNKMPFEMHAYEAIFTTINSLHDQEYVQIYREAQVTPLLPPPLSLRLCTLTTNPPPPPPPSPTGCVGVLSSEIWIHFTL